MFLKFFGQNEKIMFYDIWVSQIETGFGGIQLSPLVREKNRFYVLSKTLFIKQTVSLGEDLKVTTYVKLHPSLHRKRPN